MSNWAGLTATGLKGASAEAHQATCDAQNAAARARNATPAEQPTPPPAAKGDGGNVVHFDGSFAPGPCKCGWKRDGRLGIARRQDGSVVEGTICPTCGKALYDD